jgi:hypothetical protein
MRSGQLLGRLNGGSALRLESAVHFPEAENQSTERPNEDDASAKGSEVVKAESCVASHVDPRVQSQSIG